MDYPGIDGFIPGSRASIMLDVVFLAMFVVLPVMGWSIFQVKYRRNYRLHKWVQILLGIVLYVAVALFEVDMQFITDWRARAADSPHYPTWVDRSLWIHLFFAIPTAVLWAAVTIQAVRKFPNPPAPCEHSSRHMFWARIASIEMTLTAVTGWVFYYLAFLA